VDSSFFEPAGPDTFVATQATVGPWSPDAQHGGPPSALAARLIDAHSPTPDQRLASVAVDILRPVPVGKLTATTRMVRPGRRVALVETVLEAAGQEVLRARGWRIAVSDTQLPLPDRAAAPPPEIPAEQPPEHVPGAIMHGYMAAMDWRYVTGGGLGARGPAAVWIRPRIPLLPGAETSPMSRALLIADSGNGVSGELDPASFLFLNVDLKVMLHRDPVGEWLLLDAVSDIGPAGTGVAASTLSDVAGPCGRGMQTLLVAPR
jgi:hypothetical protein